MLKVGWTLLVLSVFSASARILQPEYTVHDQDVKFLKRPAPSSNLNLNSNEFPNQDLNQVCRFYNQENQLSYGPCSVTNEDHHENYVLKQDEGNTGYYPAMMREGRQEFEAAINEIIPIGEFDELSPGDWSYKGDTGPEFWSENYPTCGGLSQSPIDIHLKYNSEGENKALKLNSYDSRLPATLLHGKKNMDFEFDEEPPHIQPSVSGGYIPNNDSYEFAGLHFHWGKNNSFGSEHLINGTSYPAEAHFVHFNKKYGTLPEAADKPDGLLVLGFFMKVSETSTPGLHYIAEGMSALEFGEDAEAVHLIEGISLNEILGYGSDPKYVNQYVFYKGSLTTPPCTENVLWHVFPKPIPIKQEDLLHFRRMRSFEEGFPTYSDNYRPVQPLNGREVLWNGENCNV